MSKNLGARPLRWLHLSDLHFKAAEKWDRRATLAALIRKVEELRDEGRGPDLVFLTGDIAYSGKKAEYDQAFDFFDQLQAATGLKMSERFFLIPGNHDVDRGQVKKAEDRTLKAESQGEIEELLRDQEMMKRLGRRLEAFYAFTERIQGPARGWTGWRPCSPPRRCSFSSSATFTASDPACSSRPLATSSSWRPVPPTTTTRNREDSPGESSTRAGGWRFTSTPTAPKVVVFGCSTTGLSSRHPQGCGRSILRCLIR